MLGRSITRNSILLAIFAACTTALIAGTHLLTKDDIAAQKRLAEEKALLQVVPRSRHDNSMLDDTIAVGPQDVGLDLREDKQIYVAREDGEVVAVIIPAVAPDGYTGDIELIVGVNRDGTIAGVRALAQRETPGLGDKVDLKKSDSKIRRCPAGLSKKTRVFLTNSRAPRLRLGLSSRQSSESYNLPKPIERPCLILATPRLIPLEMMHNGRGQLQGSIP